MVNKLNYIKSPKQYKSKGFNAHLKNIKDCNRLYVHTQTVASVLWDIQHDLGTFPVIIVVDNQGNRVYGQETYVNKNRVTILFSIPVSGTAYLTYNVIV